VWDICQFVLANRDCQSSGLEPYSYLRQLFTEMPKAETVDALEALLPDNRGKD